MTPDYAGPAASIVTRVPLVVIGGRELRRNSEIVNGFFAVRRTSQLRRHKS